MKVEKIYDDTALMAVHFGLRPRIRFWWLVYEDGPQMYYKFLNRVEKHINARVSLLHHHHFSIFFLDPTIFSWYIACKSYIITSYEQTSPKIVPTFHLLCCNYTSAVLISSCLAQKLGWGHMILWSVPLGVMIVSPKCACRSLPNSCIFFRYAFARNHYARHNSRYCDGPFYMSFRQTLGLLLEDALDKEIWIYPPFLPHLLTQDPLQE